MEKKKEFAIGEEFQCGLVRLRVKKSADYCDGCYFLGLGINCEIINNKITGSCVEQQRNDKSNVIFVKVEE